MNNKDKVIQAEGSVALKQIEILGHNYLIDELFEEEEVDRLFIELGLESDEEEDLEEELNRHFHVDDEDDNEEGG